MATRFYLRKDEAAAVSPAFHSTWADTSTAVRRAMYPAEEAGDTPANEAHAQAGTIDMVLHRQYVSEPLEAGHVFDTSVDYKAQVQVFESATNDNLADAITIRIVSEDGSVVRHVIFPDANLSGGSGLEWGTALRNEQFATVANCVPVGSYETVAGDRLVVEFGSGDLVGSLPITGTSRWGSDGTDLPENRTETGTTFIPWFETTLDLTFAGSGTVEIGQALETDTAQAITPFVALIEQVGQALETDTAQPIAHAKSAVLGQAFEQERARQIFVEGGILPASEFPVLIRAAGRAGRVFHEFSSPGGDAYIPAVANWRAEEEAPGGFMAATGEISQREFRAHREVFQAESMWRSFLEDGTCVHAGRLLSPDVDRDSSIVQLTDRGRAQIVEREIGPILYQSVDAYQWGKISAPTDKWEATISTVSHGNTDAGIIFSRKSSTSTSTDGGPSIVIPYFGRELAYLRCHVQGSKARLEIFTSRKQPLSSIFNSGELDIDSLYENYYLHFTPTTAVSSGEIEVDLTIGANHLSFPNAVLSNAGAAVDAGIGYVWPDLLVINVGDDGETTLANRQNATEVLLSNLEINGSAIGSNRRFTVVDLVRDIAARLGFRVTDIEGGSYDILPYELSAGVPAAEALDMACVLSGKRYRILDNGWRGVIEFGRWNDRVWRRASPWSKFDTTPLERFDTVSVPFRYAGTQLEDNVLVRVENSPLDRRNVFWELELGAYHNADRARDAGALWAEILVRPRRGGDFSAAELLDEDGQKRSAHHVNAGDIVRPGGKVGSLTRFDDHVEGTFDGDRKAFERMLARRARRQEVRELRR